MNSRNYMQYVTLSTLEAIQKALGKKSKSTKVKTVFPPLSSEKIKEVIMEFTARPEYQESQKTESKTTWK